MVRSAVRFRLSSQSCKRTVRLCDGFATSTPLWAAIVAALGCGLGVHALRADEPVTFANLVEPGPNDADEPLAREFSLDRAAQFLDSAALSWQKEKQCFTCHTNYAYLYARPLASPDAPAHREVRKFAEALVAERWKTEGPRWDAEVVATAAALAFNDAASTGSLHPLTREALDRMWTVQRDDGGWEWLKCNWPPMEYDDHYGVALAAIAVGVAPENYRDAPAAKEGMARVRKYLQANPPQNLHHWAMLLWASKWQPDLITPAERSATVNDLFSKQNADGGWSAAALGDWNREDGSPQTRDVSDGYGTGFVLYVLGQAGVDKGDARIERGVGWLKTHQRQSGRWFARSLYQDHMHYLSHAGTAFSVMALATCDASAGR